VTIRWWRIGVVIERDGEPWTWTFHVRAHTENKARALVAERLAGERHAIHACHPSDPLIRVPPKETIAADYGPYRRSWSDPAVAALLALLENHA